MILSDFDIRVAVQVSCEIEIDPFDERCIQPSSYDVHIGNEFRVFRNHRYPFIDPAVEQPGLTEAVVIPQPGMFDESMGEVDQPFMLHPGEFVLGITRERIKIGSRLVARIEGKSSLGRLGLLIHSTAGYVDPGWDGRLTLELSNVANLPIAIHPGMKIGQVSFARLMSEALHPYGSPELGSKYQGAESPEASRFHQEFS